MRFYILIGLLSFSLSASAQKFYRFKADVSVKDKLANGSYRLTMGKVYYDKIYKKIVYDLTFPHREKLVIQDTTMFKINSEGLLENTTKTLLIPDFTVFHLALTGKLFDYGLNAKTGDKQIYKVAKVEKIAEGIKTTWEPSDDYFAKFFGRIVMLNKNKRLDTMIFYDEKGRMASRQFFKKYTNVKGVEFPQEVTMISYAEDGTKNIQQTTYKNIVIDDSGQNDLYRFRIPITRSASTRTAN